MATYQSEPDMDFPMRSRVTGVHGNTGDGLSGFTSMISGAAAIFGGDAGTVHSQTSNKDGIAAPPNDPWTYDRIYIRWPAIPYHVIPKNSTFNDVTMSLRWGGSFNITDSEFQTFRIVKSNVTNLVHPGLSAANPTGSEFGSVWNNFETSSVHKEEGTVMNGGSIVVHQTSLPFDKVLSNTSQSLHDYVVEQHQNGEKMAFMILDGIQISGSQATGANVFSITTGNYSTALYRPKLIIDYTPGEVMGTEFNAGSVEVNAGNVTLERDSE